MSEGAPTPDPGARPLGSSSFAQEKFSYAVTAPEPASPLEPVLGAPERPTRAIPIPSETGRLHLAIDVAGDGTWAFELRAPDGRVLHSAEGSGDGKLVALVDTPPGGNAQLAFENEGALRVGVVSTAFPAGFQPGQIASVSFPEQTEIDHSFRPARIELPAGQPARITLFDYDPHAGIENLQHNLAIPELGVRTEGRTTWGEARTLDLTPASRGEYAFVCEFHKFSGTLVVV